MSRGIRYEDLNAGPADHRPRGGKIPNSLPERFDHYARKFEDLRFFAQLRSLRPLTLKNLFGGLGVYQRRRLILVLMQSPGDRAYKNIFCGFDIWDGILLPSNRRHHESLLKEFPFLQEHPVLGKWLYLPRAQKSFAKRASTLSQHIPFDRRFGTLVKAKKRS